jgi:hypothetical protein
VCVCVCGCHPNTQRQENTHTHTHTHRSPTIDSSTRHLGDLLDPETLRLKPVQKKKGIDVLVEWGADVNVVSKQKKIKKNKGD